MEQNVKNMKAIPLSNIFDAKYKGTLIIKEDTRFLCVSPDWLTPDDFTFESDIAV